MNNQFSKNNFMIRINLSYWYYVSELIHPLTELKGKQSFDKIIFKIYNAYEHSIEIINRNELRKTSSKYAYFLKNIMESCLEKLKENQKSVNFSAEEIDILVKATMAFERAYKDDLAAEHVYVITPKGGYSIDILIENPYDAFPLNIVPESKDDIIHAAKCLAFEIPAACAFYLQRINESVLHKY